MSQLTEEDFLHIKYGLRSGRLSPDNIRFYLGVFMFVSGIAVGIAYMVATASNTVIGWENLSVFWQTIFKLQVVLFLFQLILIFFVKGKSNWSQMLLNISYVFYTYKLALDPFITVSMFAMDSGGYEKIVPIMLIIIIVGAVLHLVLIRSAFKTVAQHQREKQTSKKQSGGKLSFTFISILFLLATLTGYVVRNDLLGNFEGIFIMSIISILYISLLVGAVEFVLAAYCLIRFPSFRVNNPASLLMRMIVASTVEDGLDYVKNKKMGRPSKKVFDRMKEKEKKTVHKVANWFK